uniref:Uncharacterized protein n=1 Tax=Acrobeloides nanus TaxID=290746 RepID=A0A914BUN0_9BILA
MLQDVAMAIIKPLKKPASVTAKQSQIGTAGGISIGVVLLAVLLVASCLGVLYYRNKYNKEKDPAFPTISYYPDDEQYSRPEFNDVNHEFHNPLSFRKDIIASEEDEITNRKLYQEKSLDFDRNQNMYASVDEIQGKPSNSTRIPDAPPSTTLPRQPPKNFNTNSFDNPNRKSMEFLIDVDSDAHQYDELKKPAVENISSDEPYEVPSSRSTVDPTNGYSRFTNVSKNNSSGPA